MRITEKYKFKIKELRDSPPDITVGEENWDKLETELSNIENNIKVVANKFDFEDWANMPGAIYEETKTSENMYITTLTVNGIKKAERKEYPENKNGEYITEETIFKVDGSIQGVIRLKEYKVGDVWKKEVIR
ncbi:MAG: hypothetical protein ACRDA4_00200 [Filifactoraceae bacterium]